MQLRPSTGSTGQGCHHAHQIVGPPTVNNMPATVKTTVLCSLSQMSCGTAETNPTRTAPAPTEINAAGNTQQTRVVVFATKIAIAMLKLP
jgi:hypothetical protein